jgi:hypothetical protein
MDFSLVHALPLLSILSHLSTACSLAWMDSLNPHHHRHHRFPHFCNANAFPAHEKTCFEVKTPSICIADGAICLALLSSHCLPFLLPCCKIRRQANQGTQGDKGIKECNPDLGPHATQASVAAWIEKGKLLSKVGARVHPPHAHRPPPPPPQPPSFFRRPWFLTTREFGKTAWTGSGPTRVSRWRETSRRRRLPTAEGRFSGLASPAEAEPRA